MRKIFCILSCLLVAGCTSFDRPYDGALRELRVTAVYPEGSPAICAKASR